MQTILDKLRKIQALAESGVDGERENAQRLLDELCARHHVTPGQLVSEEKTRIRIPYKDALDKVLVSQVLFYITQAVNLYYAQGKGYMRVELTAAQTIDVLECLDHYRRLWRKQLGAVMDAFIHANHIYGPGNPEEFKLRPPPTPEEQAERKRIAQMVLFMETSHWNKRLKLNP